jgi:hypothetical protein
MAHNTHVVFNEYIPTGTDGTGSNFVYTGSQHNHQLAKHSNIAIHVVCDNSTSTGTFKLTIEESCDARNWIERNGGTPEITTAALSTGVTQKAWSDACDGQGLSSGPLLGFVRFKMCFSNGSTASHVKVYVTQRQRD